MKVLKFIAKAIKGKRTNASIILLLAQTLAPLVGIEIGESETQAFAAAATAAAAIYFRVKA